MAAARVGALLAGDKAQRAAAYEELAAVADCAQPPEWLAACIPPLWTGVLCADASEVDSAEAQRAYLVLSRLMLLDPLTVGSEVIRDGRYTATWTAANTALAAVAAKEVGELTRSDITLAACDMLPMLVAWSKGNTAMVAAGGLDEMEALGLWMAGCHFIRGARQMRSTSAC